MMSPDCTIFLTRFTFWLRVLDYACGGIDWGVDKWLDGAKDWIVGEGTTEIVSRALITNFSNSSESVPVRISPDKLPRVKARSLTGWEESGAERGVETESGVVMDGSVDWLSVWGKRNKKLSAKDYLGAQQLTVLVETLERKVKYLISAGRLSVSVTWIGCSEELEKVTSIRFNTWKKSERLTEPLLPFFFPLISY